MRVIGDYGTRRHGCGADRQSIGASRTAAKKTNLDARCELDVCIRITSNKFFIAVYTAVPDVEAANGSGIESYRDRERSSMALTAMGKDCGHLGCDLQ